MELGPVGSPGPIAIRHVVLEIEPEAELAPILHHLVRAWIAKAIQPNWKIAPLGLVLVNYNHV